MRFIWQIVNFFQWLGFSKDDAFSERERSRIRTVDAVSLVGILASAIPIAFMFLAEDTDWYASGQTTLITMLGLTPVFLAHRISYLFKALYFCGWLILFTCVLASYGRVNATHLPLLAAPALLLFFLGHHRWRLAAMLTALSALLFIAIEYLVPWQVSESANILDAIGSEIPEQIYLNTHDLTFVVVVVATEVVIFASGYMTLSALDHAEQSLAKAHARSEMLLNNILPASIASRLKEDPSLTIADSYSDVSILFADLVGFTRYSSSQSAHEVVRILNSLFSRFDALVDRYELEKIKTIGDAYMVAGGLEGSVEDHSQRIADLALEMIAATEGYFAEEDVKLTLRIGIHRGPAVAGIVGTKRPFYDVWGDTVNVASRMETTASPGSIQITQELMEIIGSGYEVEPKDSVRIKGKGEMQSFLLSGKLK